MNCIMCDDGAKEYYVLPERGNRRLEVSFSSRNILISHRSFEIEIL